MELLRNGRVLQLLGIVRAGGCPLQKRNYFWVGIQVALIAFWTSGGIG